MPAGRLHLRGAWLLVAALAAGSAAAQPPVVELPPLPPPTVTDLADEAVGEPPTGDAWADEIEALKRRLAGLEAADEKRSAAEADRKAAEAEKKAAEAARPTVKWTGQLQADFYAVGQDDEARARFGEIPDGEAFRRARFGMFGDYGPTEYRIEMDFALAGRPSFLDVWAGLKDVPGVGRVRVGHFFEPFSLERLTPNRFVTFMERGLPDQPFAPARNMGIEARDTYLDGRGTWAVGVFRTDSDAFGDDPGFDDRDSSLTGRVTFLPYASDDGRRYAHVGFGYSARNANEGLVRFRAQPEARIGAAAPNVPFFVDTGAVAADFYQLVGFEAAWTEGPFSAHGEYFLTPVDAAAGPLLFSGWYAEASWFLTGEHRPYRREAGTFDRVKPRREFVRYAGDPKDRCVAFGPGAWQVAARVSALDLTDGPVRGGRLTDATLGVNWYLNPYLRVTANWVHAFLAEPPNGGVGTDSDADFFGMRVGYDF